MATAQQLLQAMQQMQQQNQQFQQQLMQQLVQQLGQLNVQPVQPVPAQPPAPPQYNWVRMPEKFVAGDLVEFLDDYVRCSTANGWTEQNRIQRLAPYLSGHALILFNTLRDDQKQTWADLRANLLALFYPAESRTARNIEFQAIQYIPGESIDIYAYRLERSFDQANPDYVNHPNIRREMLKSQFIKGLPEPFHTRLLEAPLLTYDQCKTTARQLLAASKLSTLPQQSSQIQFPNPMPTTATVQVPTNAFRPLYERPNNYDPDNSYYFQKSSPRGAAQRCFNCGSRNHSVRDCDVPPS